MTEKVVLDFCHNLCSAALGEVRLLLKRLNTCCHLIYFHYFPIIQFQQKSGLDGLFTSVCQVCVQHCTLIRGLNVKLTKSPERFIQRRYLRFISFIKSNLQNPKISQILQKGRGCYVNSLNAQLKISVDFYSRDTSCTVASND